MNKNYDKIETINSSSPNYPHTTTNFFLDNEIVQKNFIDSEEDKTEYFKNGKLHKDSEPAVIIKDASGFQFKYYDNGELHRKDGPAIVFASYPNLNKWYINGKQLSTTEIVVQKIKNTRDSILNNNIFTKKMQ